MHTRGTGQPCLRLCNNPKDAEIVILEGYICMHHKYIRRIVELRVFLLPGSHVHMYMVFISNMMVIVCVVRMHSMYNNNPVHVLEKETVYE